MGRSKFAGFAEFKMVVLLLVSAKGRKKRKMFKKALIYGEIS